MTSQPEAAPMDGPQASQISEPLRELVALALVAANAVLLFVGFIDLFIPSPGTTFTSRSGAAYFDFAGLEGIVLPVLAVLLATHIQPPVPRAKQITMIAVGEYAVSTFFGVISLFAWLIGSLADGAFRDAFTGSLVRIAYLAVFAAAALVVYRVWRALYYAPGARPHPSVFGRAQAYGQARQNGDPQPHGQQPGYAQPQPTQTYGQPGGYAEPGGYARPGGYPEPGDYRRPTGYGQASVVQPGQGGGSGETDSRPTNDGRMGEPGQPGQTGTPGQPGHRGAPGQPSAQPSAGMAQYPMPAPPPGYAPGEPAGRGAPGDEDNEQTQVIPPVSSAPSPPGAGDEPTQQPRG